ncbi:MAG: ATP-binding cassette domain-containing protein, partial [Clostridia bacterium]|nr:ATP-binding cassette domain-containing protein [Clostridia bacterium]
KKDGRKAQLKAVDGINFFIDRGETLGLVGESGCGKSTTGRLIINLLSPTGGEVLLEGRNVFTARGADKKQLRRDMQIIFQDPFASLNPRMRVGEILREPLIIHNLAKGAPADARVRQLLNYVGLSANQINRYPHEFSGGQRQRIGIARALAVEPKIIVCDEPVSALDVSVQAQVLKLLMNLQSELGLTYLFIAHGLNVVKHISDRVGVMYLGHIVELAPSGKLYDRPMHPYSRALFSAIPIPDPRVKRERLILEGTVPSPIDPPAGCVFCGRCPSAMERCREERPPMTEIEPDHWVSCHAAVPKAHIRPMPSQLAQN